jgi:ATP/maltotriose-dependent transcriptional regulator MalT
MSLGNVLWKLGNATDARRMLDQATEIAKQKAASFTALQAAVKLVDADIAMNNRNFSEAAAHAKQALELAGTEDRAVAAEAKYVIGWSQALSGHAAAGLKLCEEANKAAAALGDPLLLAKSQIALAEVALVNGDAKGALEVVKPAQTFFANNGMADSNWHASLIAGMASEKLLDHAQAETYLNNARSAFASLEQKWGAETFKAYQSRPDIQFYRKQLDSGVAGAR